MKHHFDNLGLTEGASQEEIQAAYERLSKELNPSNNDNQEFFIEEYEKVQQAYDALSQSSILKNSESSTYRTKSSNNQESSSKPKSSDSFTVTISKEKIEELKNKAHNSESKPHLKPSMFRNPFSFKGRIRRLEYGLTYIIYYIWIVISTGIATSISPYEPTGPYFLFLFPGLWFWLAQGAKRCHDRGNSGWYQIIPFYGLWMLFGDGEIGDNTYGSNPKGINRIN